MDLRTSIDAGSSVCQAAVSIIVEWCVAGSGSDLSEELVEGLSQPRWIQSRPPLSSRTRCCLPYGQPNPPDGFYRKCISSSGSSSTR